MNTTTEPKKKIHWPLWALLVFCGGISLILSVIHAFHKARGGLTRGRTGIDAEVGDGSRGRHQVTAVPTLGLLLPASGGTAWPIGM